MISNALDIRHVESFVAVAETRNFTVAAQRLGTVQSAVSAHIKLLEQRLNQQLLDRGRGKTVDLTPQGQAFLIKSRRLLVLADDMVQNTNAENSPDPIRLGTTVTFALSVIPDALASFSSTNPNETVTVITARSHELRELLNKDLIDVALVLDQGPHAGRTATVSTSLSWVGSVAFSDDGVSPLPLGFLTDARDLRRHATGILEQNFERAAILRTHPDPVGLRTALLAGLAITIMPTSAIVPPLRDIGCDLSLPLLGSVPVSVYLSNRQDRNRNDMFAQELISVINSR